MKKIYNKALHTDKLLAALVIYRWAQRDVKDMKYRDTKHKAIKHKFSYLFALLFSFDTYADGLGGLSILPAAFIGLFIAFIFPIPFMILANVFAEKKKFTHPSILISITIVLAYAFSMLFHSIYMMTTKGFPFILLSEAAYGIALIYSVYNLYKQCRHTT